MTRVQLLPGARFALTAGLDGRVCLWDLHATGRTPDFEFEAADLIDAVAFGDGRTVMTGEPSGRLRVWETATGRCLATRELPSRLGGLAISVGGKRVCAFGAFLRHVELVTRLDLPVPDRFEIGYFLSRPRPAAEITRDDTESAQLVKLAERSLDEGRTRKAYLLLRAAQETRGFERAPQVIRGLERCAVHGVRGGLVDGWLKGSVAGSHGLVVFSRDGDAVHAVCPEGVRRWSVGEEIAPHSDVRLARPTRLLSLSPDGRRLVTSRNGWELEIWDALTGEKVTHAARGMEAALRAQFAANGQLAAIYSDGELRTWALEPLSVSQKLPGPPGEVTDFVLSADGTVAVTTTPEGRHRAWSLAEGRFLGEADPEALTSNARLSPDGRTLWGLWRGRELRSWLMRDGRFEPRPAVTLGERTINDISFTPDGRWLATAGPGNSVTLWRLPEGGGRAEPVRSFEAHTGLPVMVRFSANARRLLSVQQGAFYVWQLDWDYTFAARKE